MAKRLTARMVEQARPRSGPNGEAIRTELSDGGGGLYLVVHPTGRRSWAVRYRRQSDGKPRKLTLEGFPPLATARRLAQEALERVAAGNDPAGGKRGDKEAARAAAADVRLVPDLVDEFVRRHVRPKSRTAAETERMLRKDVAGPWRARTVQSITRRDVVRLLDSIVDRGSPYTANRTFELIRKMMLWSVERGILESSPCIGLKAPAPETSRDRMLSDDELRWFWAATERCDYPFRPFFRMLLLTGQRRDEIAGMRRSELDLKAALWTLPRERSKNDKAHEIPLSTAALEALATVPTIAGQELLFSTNGRSSISGYSKAKARLDRMMLEAARDEIPDAVIPPWRLHDLRRTAASGMARLGQPVHVVEAVLNHRSGSIRGVAAIYNRYDYAAEKRTALEAWGRFVSELVNGESAGNVVPLREATR